MIFYKIIFNLKNMEVQEKIKDFKKSFFDFTIFIVLTILTILFVYNFSLLFFPKLELDDCYSYKYANIRSETCSYDQNYIDECYTNGNDIIYKSNCEMECSTCEKEHQQIREDYREQTTWFKIIFSAIIAIIFLFIPIREKLVSYALIGGSMISLLFATIVSFDTIFDRFFPIVVFVETLLIIFIYYKMKKRN